MNRKYLLTGLVLIVLTALLSGCSGKSEKERNNLEGLESLGTITVVAREEGSGTRNVFAENLGFLDKTTGLDLTREDCDIAKSSEEVLERVLEDKAAIGYVSAGAVDESKDKVHQVKVLEDVLDREFYLAYSGELSEAEEDFITYVRGAGQEIVGKNYEPVKKTTTFLSGKPKGTITIGGSSSMAELLRELSDAYMEINPGVTIEVIVTDSTNGLTGAMSGLYDLGMCSRDLKDYEKELLQYVPIAKDEIAVIVNNENPLEKISADNLKDIYTGKLVEWKDLNKQ